MIKNQKYNRFKNKIKQLNVQEQLIRLKVFILKISGKLSLANIKAKSTITLENKAG